METTTKPTNRVERMVYRLTDQNSNVLAHETSIVRARRLAREHARRIQGRVWIEGAGRDGVWCYTCGLFSQYGVLCGGAS